MTPSTESRRTALTDLKTHASLAERSRLLKAKKIHEILSPCCNLAGARILDLGAGSGFISKYFRDVAGPQGSVTAVDQVNQIPEGLTGVEFRLVEGTKLPFEDASFDAVIYNHVIEHVGDRDDQREHLVEINRVMKPGGALYVAVPNRWALVEPHYHLAVLSWLPKPIADLYLQVTRKGTEYNWKPLTRGQLRGLLQEADFQTIRDETIRALTLYIEKERPTMLLGWLASAPRILIRSTLSIFPTFVYTARKRETQAAQ